LKRASEKGDVEALSWVAFCYLNGRGGVNVDKGKNKHKTKIKQT